MKFFQDLEKEKDTTTAKRSVHKDCCHRLDYQFCSAGEVLFEKGKSYTYSFSTALCSAGSIGNTFYIILKGSMGVIIEIPKPADEPDKPPILVPTEVKVMEKGTSFGELALISRKPRAATIVAKEDTHLACLDKQHFASILSAPLSSVMTNNFQQRIERRTNFCKSSIFCQV